ncbi:MAG: hypothetical protein DYG98_22175 [Haliscomenobacteraceae bacterium CHB4]|nr:hypothetical protein [Haliscomenobacteraceae bacterium CHB4]
MKTIAILCKFLTWGTLALSLATCQKQDAEVDVDVQIQDVVTTDLGNGQKKLDFTVVVTQFGNTFLRDYKMVFMTLGNPSVALDSYETTLPTAREFVKHTIQPVTSGNYTAEITLKMEGINYGFGKLVKVE